MIELIYIMAVPKKIIGFLDKAKVKYETIEHKTVYTAFDKVQTLKIKPKIVGKTLVLKIDRDLAIALIPADKNLDKNKFKKIINNWRKKIGRKVVKKVSFASERLIKNKLKGIKMGAVPPFGILFGLPTVINKSLLNQPKLVLNSGHYKFSIKIKASLLKKLIPDLLAGSFAKIRK